ncbi:MAG: TVP38/TMEM64 family protein [Cyanobacteria bacterium P01_H01_bin.121]
MSLPFLIIGLEQRGVFKLLFNYQEFAAYLQMLGRLRIGLFIGCHIIATLLGLPGTLMTVAGGTVFGLFWGTVWSVLGATLGAIAAFWLARTCLHQWVERRFGQLPLLQSFQKAVRPEAHSFVLAVRFAPISPVNVVNFLFGLTPIQLKPYAIGTLVGIIPGTLAYTWLGVSGAGALRGETKVPLILALTLLTVLSILPFCAKKYGDKAT